MKSLQSLKPVTTRRGLLFIAALVWTFAGVMLFARGILMMNLDNDYFLTRMALSLIAGILFYWILFTRISKKHVLRIIQQPNDRPSVFAFFDVKGYLMMVGMVSLGVFLRSSGFISPFYLSVLYVTMGIPLFFSSIRFYFSVSTYPSIVRKINNLPS